MGDCAECIYWRDERWVMTKYGEGFGIFRQDRQVRFCSHQCPFCESKKRRNERDYDKRRMAQVGRKP